MRTRVSKAVIARRDPLASFSLVELLTVIAIIAILASLTLFAGTAMMQRAGRNRAAAEIQAMTTALENYKTDNGVYPQSDGALIPSNYTTTSGYQTNATVLFTSLTGQAYYQATPVAGVRSYMAFKSYQISSPGGPFSYVVDPWGVPYGYSTGGGGSNPNNGANFFDLWSTGGKASSAGTNGWVANW